jgi:hypothetical protein
LVKEDGNGGWQLKENIRKPILSSLMSCVFDSPEVYIFALRVGEKLVDVFIVTKS